MLAGQKQSEDLQIEEYVKKMSVAVVLKRSKIRNNKPRRNYYEPICISLSWCRARAFS